MATDAEARARQRFLREDPRTSGNLFSRLAEQRRREAGRQGGAGTGPTQSPRRYELPARPGARATLVEYENPEEYLEFHWDPSSYDLSKSAKWTSSAVEGGTDTLAYSGTDAMVVSCELLFDEVDVRHSIQRSVEDSIAWLVNRTRPRSAELVGRSGPTSRPGEPWLNLRDPQAPAAPPVLVLFGLRDGFICVLERVKVTTVFQAPPALRPAQLDSAFSATERDVASVFPSGAIRRARVQVSLREYANVPEAGPADKSRGSRR